MHILFTRSLEDSKDLILRFNELGHKVSYMPVIQIKKVDQYFEKMIELKSKTNLNELSMGMSNDYVEAAKCSSTYVRVGSKIFGARN